MSMETQPTSPEHASLPSRPCPAWTSPRTRMGVLTRFGTHNSVIDEESLHHLSGEARSTLEQGDTNSPDASPPSPPCPAWTSPRTRMGVLARFGTHNSVSDEESLHHLSVGARSTLEQGDACSEQSPNRATQQPTKSKENAIESTIPADTTTETAPPADSSAPEQPAEDGSDDEVPILIETKVARARWREQEIREVLSVIRHNAPCLLLCRENQGGFSEVFPLQVESANTFERQVRGTPATYPSDVQIDIWRGMQDTWYNMTGRWKKRLLPWYGVKRIQQVKVCVLGTSPTKQNTLLAELYTIGVEDEINKLRQEMAGYDETILNERGGKNGWCANCCEYNELTDRYSHNDRCPFMSEVDYNDGVARGECPLIERNECLGKLLQLSRLSLMPGIFHNPEFARANDLIPSSFYFTRGRIENLSRIRHEPSLADLDFCGFKLEEGMLINPLQSWPGAALLTAFLAILMGTREMYGDWATAWTAVGSIAAIIAVLIAWTRVAVQ
ncbi:hypothetical protein QBC42DRAFT_347287 [Cladorrhinum samala]|uniref:Transmembrane protein n=1 Tax=Cladorrhinum samala TaxID=585594 RepID=A0AAV9HMW2_9PEZI|nr:hypothetical protein QBC42DRAFT_347287 [Cladorrhinum samala]